MAKKTPNQSEEALRDGIPTGPTSDVLEGDDSPDQADETTEYRKQTLEDEVDFSRKKATEAEDDSPFGVWSSETVEPARELKALFYGPTGSGKTWLAATFPKPLFLDLERGMRTTLQLGPVLRYPKNPSDKITTLDQVRDFHKLVRRQKNTPFETIVIDSLAELYVLVVREVLGVYDANRQYDDQMTMADYGKANRLILDIIRSFLNLPYHIVMTAVQTDPEYEGALVYPRFTGKQIWPELQRVVDQIGYCHVRKGAGEGGDDYVVSFKLTPQYVAKDRLAIKQRYIPNNFEAILAAIPPDALAR
jgi:hypothetical protein